MFAMVLLLWQLRTRVHRLLLLRAGVHCLLHQEDMQVAQTYQLQCRQQYRMSTWEHLRLTALLSPDLNHGCV